MTAQELGGAFEILGLVAIAIEYLKNRRTLGRPAVNSVKASLRRLRDRLLRRTHPVGKSVTLKWDVEAHETTEQKVERHERLLKGNPAADRSQPSRSKPCIRTTRSASSRRDPGFRLAGVGWCGLVLSRHRGINLGVSRANRQNRGAVKRSPGAPSRPSETMPPMARKRIEPSIWKTEHGRYQVLYRDPAGKQRAKHFDRLIDIPGLRRRPTRADHPRLHPGLGHGATRPRPRAGAH